MDKLSSAGSYHSLDIECPSCGSKHVSSTNEIDSFQYGDKVEAVTLTVTVPVHHCADCGMSYTIEDASEIRHDAVCAYLGILNPREIRALRERYNLSQAQFADITKLGKASLARWEGGQHIQNQANDNLLYLLSFQDNLERLQEKALKKERAVGTPSNNVIKFKPKFRNIGTSELDSLKSEAKKFELFPARMVG